MSQILKLEEERETEKLTHGQHYQIVKNTFDAILFPHNHFRLVTLSLSGTRHMRKKVIIPNWKECGLDHFKSHKKLAHQPSCYKIFKEENILFLLKGWFWKNYFLRRNFLINAPYTYFYIFRIIMFYYILLAFGNTSE